MKLLSILKLFLSSNTPIYIVDFVTEEVYKVYRDSYLNILPNNLLRYKVLCIDVRNMPCENLPCMYITVDEV